MNTTTPKNHTTYTFTTCKRCGYIIDADEELCQACKNQNPTQPNSLLGE